MILMDYVVFTYQPDFGRLVLFRIDDDSDFIFSLKSQVYSSELNDLFSGTIELAPLLKRLNSQALLEFNKVVIELQKLGLIKPILNISWDPSEVITSATLVGGQYFVLELESMRYEVQATTYSEGEACSPLGLTYCETNTGYEGLPRETWECISGSPNNWSAMGQSC